VVDSTAAATGAGILGAMWLLWCCLIIFGLLLFAFRIWMLIHALTNAPEDQKVMWALLIFFIPFVDWVYFFTKKKEWGGKKAAPAKTE